MTTPPGGGETGRRVLEALRAGCDNVFVNPAGVVVVPHGRTSVFIEHAPVGELELITLRAPILQNLTGTPELFEYVALHATLFKLGELYLFAEGAGYDLDFQSRTFIHWVPPEDVGFLVGIVADTATGQAEDLQPRFGGTLLNASGATYRRVFAEDALARNSVVSDALEAKLDTHRTAIMGAAAGAWVSPGDAVLGQVVFAMTATDLWLAGWPPTAQEPAVWRTPYREISEDLARHDNGASDYLARVAGGRWLGVRMIEPEAADAMARVRADPTAHF